MRHISEAVASFLKKSGINERQELGLIVEKWGQIAPDFCKSAEPFKLDKKKLFIQAENSVVVSELSYRKKTIKELVNRLAGREAVKEIVLRIRQ